MPRRIMDELVLEVTRPLLVPILSLFLGPILHILTRALPRFSVFCTIQLPLQASGMTKLGFMSILFIIIILWFQWLKLA